MGKLWSSKTCLHAVLTSDDHGESYVDSYNTSNSVSSEISPRSHSGEVLVSKEEYSANFEWNPS